MCYLHRIPWREHTRERQGVSSHQTKALNLSRLVRFLFPRTRTSALTRALGSEVEMLRCARCTDVVTEPEKGAITENAKVYLRGQPLRLLAAWMKRGGEERLEVRRNPKGPNDDGSNDPLPLPCSVSGSHVDWWESYRAEENGRARVRYLSSAEAFPRGPLHALLRSWGW